LPQINPDFSMELGLSEHVFQSAILGQIKIDAELA
jgi:hypothetical protein